MKVNVESLVRQAIRWGVTPHPTVSVETAHDILMKLPRDQRVHLQWCCNDEWQLVISTTLVTSGSFEHCVTTLAARFNP